MHKSPFYRISSPIPAQTRLIKAQAMGPLIQWSKMPNLFIHGPVFHISLSSVPGTMILSVYLARNHQSNKKKSPKFQNRFSMNAVQNRFQNRSQPVHCLISSRHIAGATVPNRAWLRAGYPSWAWENQSVSSAAFPRPCPTPPSPLRHDGNGQSRPAVQWQSWP